MTVLPERCFLSAHRDAFSKEVFTSGDFILITPAYDDHRDANSSGISNDATAHVGFDLHALLRIGFDRRAPDVTCLQMLPVEHAPGGHPESFRAAKGRSLLCDAAEGC